MSFDGNSRMSRRRLDKYDALPIEAALCMARLSELRSRHGAVIADRQGNILGRGHNVYEGGLSTTHAEVVAIGDAIHNDESVFRGDRGQLTLYSCRALGTGQHGCALPCGECEALIRKVGIKRVVYTGSDGGIELVWY